MPTRGIEPRTSGLQDLRSTTELYGLVLIGHVELQISAGLIEFANQIAVL